MGMNLWGLVRRGGEELTVATASVPKPQIQALIEFN
jgi:hypothetical protein